MTARLSGLALLLLAAVARLLHPGADPPLDFGAAHVSDEGYYAKNAKERVLRGQWLAAGDEHNHLWLSPLVAALNALAFAAAKPSVEAARAVSALSGVALVALAGWYLRRRSTPAAVWATMALLALAPALVAFGRMALAESLLATLSLGFALALARDLEATGPPWRSLLLFVLAFLVKASAIALLPVALLSFALHALSGRRGLPALRAALSFSVAIATFLGLWYLLFIRPIPGALAMFRHESRAHDLLYPMQDSPVLAARAMMATLAEQHAVLAFVRDPVMAGLALAALALVVVEAARAIARPPLELVAASWLVGCPLFHLVSSYQPARYFIGLAVPAALLVGPLLADPVAAWQRSARGFGRARGLLLLPLVLGIASALRAAHFAAPPAALALGLFAALLAALLFARGAARILLGLALVVPAAVVVGWLRSPSYSIADASRALAASLAPGSVVVGTLAPALTLSLETRAVVMVGRLNRYPDAFLRLGVTHVLADRGELGMLERFEPRLGPLLVPELTVAPAGGARGNLTLYRLRDALGREAP